MSELNLACCLFTVAFAAVLIISLHSRLTNGATVEYLIQTRGYESAPLRGLIWTSYLTTWIAVLALGCLLLRITYMRFLAQEPSRVVSLGEIGLLVLLTVGGSAVVWLLRVKVVQIDMIEPLPVGVTGVRISDTIPRERLDVVGDERFPHNTKHSEGDNTIRRWMVFGLIILVGLAAWGGFSESPDSTLKAASHDIINLNGWALFVGLSAASTYLLFLLSDPTYQLMSFRRLIKMNIMLLIIIWIAAGVLFQQMENYLLFVAASLIPWVIRLYRDLARCRHHRIVECVLSSMRQDLADCSKDWLPTIPSHPDCVLPDLSAVELADRISHGCRNVEEASSLVTRSFARYMELVEALREPFACVMLRFLTVRRYVTESSGCGTCRPQQNPEVPMWNEKLFPIDPPTGFVHWLVPLGLNRSWDRVSLCYSCSGTGQTSCLPCNGSGKIQRTESYTEGSGNNARTETRIITETCSSCGGSGRVMCTICGGLGRLEFNRTLNTQWQRCIVSSTWPRIANTDLIEDAEERVYYYRPIMENRTRVTFPTEQENLGNPLVGAMATSGQSLVDHSVEGHCDRIENLHDGIMYRVDYQVVGFWTVNIIFERLAGRLGWFFGKRPEFYFPQLPLDYYMVATAVFLPPLAIAVFYATVMTIISVLR